MPFGDILKKRRILVGLSLPELAFALGLKPSDLNRIERNVQLPDKSDKFLTVLAELLLIEKDSSEYAEFKAALEQAQIPEREILSDEKLLKKLPVAFRTRDKKMLSNTQLTRLAEKLRYEFG